MDPRTAQVPDDVADAFATLDAVLVARMASVRARIHLAKGGGGQLTDASLAAALTDPSEKVRARLVENPWCPTWALEQLSCDRHRPVARRARFHLFSRRGALPGEFASRARIDEIVDSFRDETAYVEARRRRELSDTWGFTAADVTTILAACPSPAVRGQLAHELSANQALDAEGLEAVASALPGFAAARWARHPSTSPERIRAVVGETHNSAVLQLAGHRNCPPDVACLLLTRHRRDVLATVDLSHPHVERTATELVRMVVASQPGLTALQSIMESLRVNPTAPPVLVELVARPLLRIAGGYQASVVLGDRRAPLDVLLDARVSCQPASVRLLCLARLCSGRTHAADVLLAAHALADNGTDLTFVELVEVAESIVC